VDIKVGALRGDDAVKLRLEAAGSNTNPPAEFALTSNGKSGQITATATLGSSAPLVRKTISEEREEARLLFEELEIFGHDSQYEQALLATASMLDPNYHGELVKGSMLA
jgi:hypothetical protein